MGWSKFSFAALLIIAGLIARTDAETRVQATSQPPAPQPHGVKPALPPTQQPAAPPAGPSQTASPAPVRPASPPAAPPTPPPPFLVVLDGAHVGGASGGAP